MSDEIIELDLETKVKFKDLCSEIKASPEYRKKITNIINSQGETSKNIIYFNRQLSIAASVAFLIGLGMLLPIPFTKLPTLAQLHQSSNRLQITTDNIAKLSKHIGYGLSEEQLLALKNANFNVVGANKKIIKGKELSLIVLKNDKGEKLSICFLPEDYKFEGCHTLNIIGIPENYKYDLIKNGKKIDTIGLPANDSFNVFLSSNSGLPFECGKDGDLNFAVWKKNNKNIAIISEGLSELEMISLIVPLA